MRKLTFSIKLRVSNNKKNPPIFEIDLFCQAPGVGFVCDVTSLCNAKKLLFAELRYCGFLCKPLTVPSSPLANKSLNLGFGFTACYSSLRDPQPSHTLTDVLIVEILRQKALEK